MSFNETEVVRDTTGKFAEKTGATPEVELDDPAPLLSTSAKTADGEELTVSVYSEKPGEFDIFDADGEHVYTLAYTGGPEGLEEAVKDGVLYGDHERYCIAEIFAETRWDQASYCENDTVPGTDYCTRHQNWAEQD